jgi:hypothetical protein
MVAHAHGPFGAGIRALYGALGTPLPLPANLSAYQLRQWGVTGDPDANGTLRVRASILNTAAQLQPYPLLRVNLADRFGKSIGRRDFEPPNIWASRLRACSRPANASTRPWTFWIRARMRKGSRSTCACAAPIKESLRQSDAARSPSNDRQDRPLQRIALQRAARAHGRRDRPPRFAFCAAASARDLRRRKCSPPMCACGTRRNRAGAWTTRASPARAWCRSPATIRP